MTNDHKTSYKDEYRAKVNPDFSWQDLDEEDDLVELTEKEFIDSEHTSASIATSQTPKERNSVIYTYDEQKAEYKLLNQSEDLPPDNELDEILSAFVSSDFDLNTLDEWDKTKKN